MRSASAILRLSAAVACAAAAPAVELADGIQIHGFVSQGYLRTTGTDWFGSTSGPGSFEFNEAAVNVGAQPVDRLRLGMQIMVRDMADSGNDAVIIDWAFADYRLRPEFGVKAGRFKLPFGLFNESQDLDFDHTSVFLPMCLYQPQYRDYMIAIQGGMVYGSLGVRTGGTIDYNLYVGGQNLDTRGDIATYLQKLGAGDTLSSIHLDHMAGATLTWRTPVEGLRLRLSGLMITGFESVGDRLAQPVDGSPGVYADLRITTSIQRLLDGVVSLEYQRRALTLTSEFLTQSGSGTTDVVAKPYTLVPTGPPLNGTTRVDLPASRTTVVDGVHNRAYYATLAYRLFDRFELSASRQLLHQSDGEFDHTWSIAARYDLLDNWLVKGEWQFHRGNSLATESLVQTWTLFALRTTVDF